MQPAIHENFVRDENLTPGSTRSFGKVMAGAFAVVSAINYWHSGRIWPWTLALAVAFIVAAYVWPDALKPLNRLWFKLGLAMHRVVNPIVMGFLFYGCIVPTSLIMRAFNKDLLRLRRAPDAGSYWIVREPRGPAPQSMKDQF